MISFPSRFVLACCVLLIYGRAALAEDVSPLGLLEPAPSEVQPTPLEDDANLHDVQFVGGQIGWAVGDHGVIWNTRDGGQTWRLVPSPVDCPLRSVCFLTDQVGWVAGGGTTPFTQVGYGVILFTSDGGRSWEQRAADELPPIHAIRFFGLDQGVAAGGTSSDHPTGLFLTSDGGKTWRDVDGERNAGWRAADFQNTEIGLTGAVAGRQGRVLLVGGDRLLSPRLSDLGLRNLRDVRLLPDDRGWLVGDGGLVLSTENGGVVWQSPPTPLPHELRDIFDFHAVECRGARVWVAGHPGTVIWHSADGGRTWSKQFTGQSQPIFALTFTSDSEGWAVGAFGMILHTSDGGQTWSSVRGGRRRAALMALHARPSQVSFQLLAKHGGELGYRSVVALLPRPDVGPDGHAARDLDLRLHEAVTRAGGSLAEIYWRLPIAVPGLEKDRRKLIEEWNRRTEGHLTDVFLGHLVCRLRTWKPDVLILDEPPKNDAATQLVYDAVLAAVEQAADPTRFLEHSELAGLEPWKVKKVYHRLADGSTGDAHVEAHELLQRRGRTVAMASAASYALVQPPERPIPQREAYRLLVRYAPAAGELAAGGSFFAGIALAADSAARRPLLDLDESQMEHRRKLAQRQLHFRAYTDRMIENEQRAAALIGELNSVIEGVPDDQAALQLFQLAGVYRQQSRWDLVEATYVELVERFPDQPVAVDAMRWLLQFWSSVETAWQRSRKMGVVGRRMTSDMQAIQNRIQKAAYLAQVAPHERDGHELNEGPDPLGVLESSGQLQIGPEENWRAGAVRNWHRQAVNMARLIRAKAPALYTTPQIEFPLASLLRQRGALTSADQFYRRYRSAGVGDPWKQAALAELWLTQPANLPPRPVVLCRLAVDRPFLDGVLSDKCWLDADELPLRHVSETDPESRLVYPFGMLAYDSKFLYFAASIPRVPGTRADGPVCEGRDHDADLSPFDRISLYLDLDRDYATYYALHIDQRGWTAESCWEDAAWNPQWYVAADADETHWRVEIAIPMEELAARPPTRHAVWAVGLVRTVPTVGLQSWTHPAGTKPRPESFGLVRFD